MTIDIFYIALFSNYSVKLTALNDRMTPVLKTCKHKQQNSCITLLNTHWLKTPWQGFFLLLLSMDYLTED